MKQKKLVSAIITLSIVLCVTIGYTAYSISQMTWDQPQSNGFGIEPELHLWSRQFRNGVLIAEEYHAMTLTNYGKWWLKERIANSAITNSTFANYIGLTADTTVFSANWTVLISEITLYGLARALATYTSTSSATSGLGLWNMTKTFACTGTQAVQTYGLYTTARATMVNTLIAAEVQGTPKNLINGDSLQVTIQGAIS